MNDGAVQKAIDAADLTRIAADASLEVIYFLDGQYRVEYCNPAWDDFALKNRGQSAVRRRVIGTDLFTVIPPVLEPFFRELFTNCLRTRQSAVFDYECSSDSTFRIFQMRVVPRKNEPGLIVINSPRIERPHHYEVYVPDRAYEGESGIVAMCAHCRRTRRASESERWDWVPQYVRDPKARVSHSICPICEAYYYETLPRRM